MPNGADFQMKRTQIHSVFLKTLPNLATVLEFMMPDSIQECQQWAVLPFELATWHFSSKHLNTDLETGGAG